MSACCPILSLVPAVGLDHPRCRGPGKVPVFHHRRHRFPVLRDGERGVGRIRGHGQRRRDRHRSIPGGESTTSRAVVLSPGYAYRLRADLLQHEFEHDGPLPHLLLRYTQALIAQIGQISACKRHHTLEQRLCRWILSCLDRLPSNEMTMTQELIADMLGVRREGVTEAVGRLQRAGLIHCSRGHIVVARPPRTGSARVRAAMRLSNASTTGYSPITGKPKPFLGSPRHEGPRVPQQSEVCV